MTDNNKETSLRDIQDKVNRWINDIGGGYFSELTNLAVLMEETGELARIIARKYGDQIAKPDDNIDRLADEMADVLWVIICLANQTGIDLTDAFNKSLMKKTERDFNRFKPRREKNQE